MQTVKKRWWYRLLPSILSVLMIVCSFGMAAPTAVYAVDDIEPPAWPAESKLTADVCGSSVILSWPAATDNVGVVCYEVYKNDGLIDTVTGATQRSCTVSGLDPSVYTFGVQAVDAAGNHSEALTANATVEAVALTITGDGVETPMTFSMTDLQEMEQYQHLYSSINTWPTKKWYAGEGVKLTDLLASAGIKDEATLITVKATDGYRMTFTRQELLEDPRYYYPGLRENDVYDGSIPGSPDGAQQVETIIALRSAQSDNFENMNTSEALHLLMGQRWVTEQTNNAFVKFVGTIEVSTEIPEKWANPIADPPSGTVDAGTGVIFDPVNINDMDGANFHYTTDGSDPTYESPMYNWIKYRWWSSRSADLETINHPINVDHNMTIKAVAIGFGREDSDIVTFNYQVPLLINTGNPANATENEAYAGHTFTAAGGVEPYSFAVTEGTLPAGMELNGAILEGTPTTSGTFVFTVTVTDSANPADIDSHEFTMVVDEAGAVPPALTADTSDNKVGQAIDITFTEDAAWQAAISGIKVNDTDLNIEQYTLSGGSINIIADVFTAAGDYVITVQATGYADAVVTQTVEAASDFVVNEGILVAYQGSGGDVVIPDNLGITGIGDAVFQNLTGLTSIIIPEGVTSIGEEAFRGCSSLTSITIPAGVTSIGRSAVRECSSLTSVTIPEGVTSIESYTFRGCSSLTSITIPNSVTSIGNSVFRECSSLVSVDIPNSVTSTGTYLFDDCTALTSIEIPGSITCIDDYTFDGCSSLSSVTISEGVGSIESNAFDGCISLTSIEIPGSVTSIGNSVFSGCTGLSSVNISEGVSSLGSGVFSGCSSLTSIVIPGSVTSIGSSAFSGCSSLASITIPESVTSIGNDTFLNCSSLTIYGYDGSYAQSYAAANSIPFVTIETVIWYVDDSGSADFTTIQTAVTAAGAWDTIIVKDGTYTENVVVDKSLVIQSENGAELTIVQAADSNADVFKVTAENVTIDGFSITGATSMGKSGIAIFGSTSGSCTIINNQCSDNNQGITIEALTTDNTVANNICTLSGRYGICLSNTTGNIITGNTCSNNTASSGYALYLADNANNNTVNDNISDSNNIGIRVKNADSNLLFNNTFTNNNYGLEIATGSLDNVFYLNNFVGNTSGQLSLGYGAVAGNFWNSQTEQTYTFNDTQYTGQVGNYWSDYTGTDADSNGIGDTPYGTFTNEYDNYPLMGQWDDGVITVTEPTPVYSVLPVADDAYTIGTTPEGIKTMTVNEGKTGFKYFTVNITPVVSHNGTETVVFTHSRNGSQLGLNATGADFDQVDTAQAGFNVQSGDVIKVYIVDELTNAVDHNPVILQ